MAASQQEVTGRAVELAESLLLFEAPAKAKFYAGWVLVLSTISAIFNFEPHFYLVSKHSFLNQYGTKLGWFWTLVIVGPFIFYIVRKRGYDVGVTLIHLARLLVATVIWFVVVNVFLVILHNTSSCELPPGSNAAPKTLNRRSCQAINGTWTHGVDFSGHAFLLVYSSLIMTEEAVAYRDYSRADPVAAILFLLMAILHVVWEIQLAGTCLYYHTLVDKMVGVGIAIGAWFVTYRWLFASSGLAPMLPLGTASSPAKSKKQKKAA